ncbi:hypothetical protein NFI96_012754 [Prochilodus magdalenae]|nr:hypothetical protein NFI96_012754 [Prochilodus magdalenae]
MVYTASQRLTHHPEASLCPEVEGEVSGVYLQSPSGRCVSDCVSRHMSVLDRLTLTHPIWLLLSITEQEATRILLQQPAGAFLVRRSSALQRKVLLLRVNNMPGPPIIHYPVKESLYTFSLEDSGISFADLFRLVAFYCISRDVLPFTLKLPEAVSSAKTPAELEKVAKLGAGFWDSETHSCSLVQNKFSNSLLCESLVTRTQRQVTRTQSQTPSGHRVLPRQESAPPALTRTCSAAPHKDQSGSHEALSFFNPLFLQTHQQPTVNAVSDIRKDSFKSDCQLQRATSKSRPVPPPRPPPPRHLPCRPALPPGQKRMPVTATWAKDSQSLAQRPKLTGTMGSKYSRTKKNAPPLPQVQPDIDHHRCTFALDEENIAKALSQANQASKAPLRHTSEVLQLWDRKGEPGQGLSDLSTSSSDSLDSSLHPHNSDLSLSTDRGLSSDNSSNEEKEDEDEYGAELQRDLQLRLRTSRNSKKLLAMGSVGSHPGSLLILPRALKGHFHKVRGVLGVLATPERRALCRIIELSRDKSSYFGCLVQDYISFVQENHSCHTSGSDLLQTIRQFLTQMKVYLTQGSELNPPIESLIPEDQIDAVLEKAMHKCVLKPLHGSLEAALHDFQVSSGAWQRLQENLALAKAKQPKELGVDGAQPPDSHAIEKVRRKLRSMCKMYSPERKVKVLLNVCKLIYNVLQDYSVAGRMFGADDFLPMLTYVLAQCDMPQLDAEIQYMMELLDPSLLHGEGGYYLTSAYGAMSLIKNFKEEQAACILSSTTRNTLHQWHQRRTTQKNLPSVEDFQNFLRVVLQEVDNGCTAKTLQVRPYTTTEEVCCLCANKFHVADPENYALFLLTDDSSQQLAPDTYPQWIKADFHSRPSPQPFYFVYRRLTKPNGCVPSLRLNSSCPPD